MPPRPPRSAGPRRAPGGRRPRPDAARSLFSCSHTRRLIRRRLHACWGLDELHPDRRLRQWAHMLGFRGHFSTKSRRHSTTLGALRQVRADYRAAPQRTALCLPGPDDNPEATTLVVAHWTYTRHGRLRPRRSLCRTSA